MLNLRVRLVKDDGSTDRTSRVLNTKTVSYAVDLNGAGTLDFSVSRNDFVPEVMPFLVRVEYSTTPEGPYKPLPEHELFIVESDSDDSLDEGKVVTYKAVAFVPWLLGGAYVGTGPWQKDNTRTINGAGHKSNAGQIMSYFIDESKGRGWLPALNRPFSSTTDSNGVAWTNADRDEIAWTLETFYPKVLEQMSEQNMCDWSAKGNNLLLYRPGTKGTDKTQLVFGGAGFSRVPVTTDVTGWYTHVIAVSDAGRVHVDNRPAEARFGRRSIAMSQTGVKDTATSTRLARDLLADGQKVKREEVFEWTPEAGGIYPFHDFLLGDLVTAKARGGTKHKRVFGVQVEQDIDGAKVQVRIGDQLKSAAIKAGKILGSVSVGGVIGGSGGSYPTSPPPPAPVPLAPDNLRVTHNTGSWDTHGNPRVTVGLEWGKVSEAVDGSEVDISEYQVWSRTPEGERTLDATVAGIANTVEITSWEPERQRLASVRGRAASGGNWSDFSLEVPVMPVAPTSIVPAAPGPLVETTNTATFTDAGPVAQVVITVPPVTVSTDGKPIDVDEYELWVDDVPVARFPTTTTRFEVPSGRTVRVRARALSSFGEWGDLSPELSVTGAKPAVVVRNPTAPVLTSGAGNAFARWGGAYVSGDTAGAHRVDVEARIGTGAWAVQGTLVGAGQQIITLGGIGDVVAVRLRAYDQLGRLTGTSVEATVTVVGVEFTDFDTLTQERIEGIEGDQLVIGRTVDGLNRTFTSVASPGRGYLGYENLAPAIKGDGTWAEVRRNLCRNPAPVGTGGWTAANGAVVGFNAAKSAVEITPASASSQSGAQIPAPAPVPGKYCLTLTVESEQGDTYMVNGTSGWGGVFTQFTLAAGETRTVKVSGHSATGTSGALYVIRANSGTSGKFWVKNVQLELGEVPVEPFTGDIMPIGVDQPEDFRVRWLGAPNASESVMEGERIRDLLYPANPVAETIVSTKAGKPAARTYIKGTSGGNPAAIFNIPAAGRAGGTFMATKHQDKVFSTIFNSYNITVVSPQQGISPRTNQVGAVENRITYDTLTSGYQAYMQAGTLDVGESVWWTDVELFAGELPVDAVKFHNGDVWRRLEDKNGKLTVVEILIWDGQDWVAYELWVDSLAAANSVTARVVNMDEGFANKFWANEANVGKIRVDYVEPNFGDNLNLSANGNIVLIAGRQDDQAAQLAGVQEELDATSERASSAADAAAAAAAQAAIAEGKALVAEQLGADTADRLTRHQSVFRVTATGAEVASTDNTNIVQITPTGVAIIQGGAPASTWDAGRLIVTEAIVSRMQLGAHVAERSGNRTTWRPLSN